MVVPDPAPKPEPVRAQGETVPLLKGTHNALFGDTLPYGTVLTTGTLDDGNCFYHSMCIATNYAQCVAKSYDSQAVSVRAFRCGAAPLFFKAALEHPIMMQARRFVQESPDAGAQRLCTDDHQWAYFNQIVYFTFACGYYPIIVAHKVYCFPEYPKSETFTKFIVLLWVNGRKHFQPVLFKRATPPGCTCPKDFVHVTGVLDRTKDTHRPVIDRLLHVTGDVCAFSP